jgi:hypothetical protein
MLFVFGYRSNKIRSKKLSNLIHHSGNHPNVQSCTVSVYFQKIVDLVSIIVYSRIYSVFRRDVSLTALRVFLKYPFQSIFIHILNERLC